MARYQNRLNRIFSAGIVWDPEEPLPEELQDDLFRSNGESQDILNTLHFPTGLSAVAQVEGPFRGPFRGPTHGPTQVTQLATHWGQQIAATWPVEGAKKRLPRFTVQEQGRNVLPPLSVTADVSIVQDTARVTVTQLFWNDSGIPIKKAAFTFPLATGCTVTDFSCRIGANKIIKGAVKPKEEAREAFRDHIRQHETAAALLEQDTPEIFTTTLGNVPEKTKVKVELTYITVLKHRFADNNNTTTLTIPTSIAPRYGDVPEDYNDAATTSVPQGLSLEVEIVESEKITSIVSTSHTIAVTRRRGARTAQTFADLAGEDDRSNVETASVALESGRIFLDKDFVLDIVTTPDGKNENPQAWLEEHPTLPNHKTLMLTLPPGFLARKAPPVQQSEILFLADCSGSMRDKIKPLRSAMRFFLKGIPEGRKFNIWCFGTKYAFWQPQSVDYTEETLNSALSWVETGMRADMGGTELLPAVQAIVAAREKALMTDVIVLTDGQTWRLEQTLDFIQKTRGLTEGRVRFFALGIGKAVSHALVDGIAKAGGGYAEVVQEASQGGWEDRVVSMAKAALMSAHLGPLHLEFNIQDQTGSMRSSTLADAKRSPADISALNPFDRSRVYFHLDYVKNSESIKSVRVEVQANHDTQTFNIPVAILDKRDTTLHKLAARAMLDDLERGRSHIHLGPNRPFPGSWQETSMVRKEAEAIACKWSLVSKWTSFFLAEERYRLTGDDAFMGEVVEIRLSPDDNLLQPYGAGQINATIGAKSPIPAELRNDLAASTTMARQAWARDDVLGEGLRRSIDFSCCSSRGKESDPPSRSDDHTKAGPPKLKLLNISTPMGNSMKVQSTLPSYCTKAPEWDLDKLDSLPSVNHDSISELGLLEQRVGALDRSESPEIQTLALNLNQPQELDRRPKLSVEAVEVEQIYVDRIYVEQIHVEQTHVERIREVERIHEVLVQMPQQASKSQQSRPILRRLLNLFIKHEPDTVFSVGSPRTTCDSPGCDDCRPIPIPVPVPVPEDQRNPPFSDRDFVTSLLNFQQYDGSIDFGSWELAEQILGKPIAEALRPLQQVWSDLSDRSLWTAAVDVLLGRHLQACKPLWELMAIKTASYCGNHPLSSAVGAKLGLLEVVGKELEGVKLPFREEEEQQQEEEPAVDLVPEMVTVEPQAHEHIPEKSPKDKAKKGRKKRKVEKGEQGGKEADAEANPPPSLVGRFFRLLKREIDEGSRHGTKSRRAEGISDGG